jgi:hypothetical protein
MLNIWHISDIRETVIKNMVYFKNDGELSSNGFLFPNTLPRIKQMNPPIYE